MVKLVVHLCGQWPWNMPRFYIKGYETTLTGIIDTQYKKLSWGCLHEPGLLGWPVKRGARLYYNFMIKTILVYMVNPARLFRWDLTWLKWGALSTGIKFVHIKSSAQVARLILKPIFKWKKLKWIFFNKCHFLHITSANKVDFNPN